MTKKRGNKKKKRTKSRNKPRRSRGTRKGIFAAEKNKFPGAVTKRLRFKHSEYITDIAPNATEYRITLPINPGLPGVFPWLSPIAMAFETYIFHSLKFFYIPTCGTTVNGSILLSPDYDAIENDTDLTLTQLYAFEDREVSTLYEKFFMYCRKTNIQKRKTYYTRAGDLPESEDFNLFDTLNLNVDVSSPTSDGTQYGTLWVEYDVEFCTPHHSLQEPLVGAYYLNTSCPAAAGASPFINSAGSKTQKQSDTSNIVDVYSKEGLSFDAPGTYEVTLRGADATGITGVGSNSIAAGSTGSTWEVLRSAYDAGGTFAEIVGKLVVTELARWDPITLWWNGPDGVSAGWDNWLQVLKIGAKLIPIALADGGAKNLVKPKPSKKGFSYPRFKIISNRNAKFIPGKDYVMNKYCKTYAVSTGRAVKTEVASCKEGKFGSAESSEKDTVESEVFTESEKSEEPLTERELVEYTRLQWELRNLKNRRIDV